MSDAYARVVAQAERSVAEAPDMLRSDTDIVVQALDGLDANVKAPARAALLAIEALVGHSLNLNAWQFHLRRDHDRAAEMLEIARRVQRALSDFLKENREGR